MAKGKIPIGEGRKLAEKYKAPIVIVFSFTMTAKCSR